MPRGTGISFIQRISSTTARAGIKPEVRDPPVDLTTEALSLPYLRRVAVTDEPQCDI